MRVVSYFNDAKSIPAANSESRTCVKLQRTLSVEWESETCIPICSENLQLLNSGGGGLAAVEYAGDVVVEVL